MSERRCAVPLPMWAVPLYGKTAHLWDTTDYSGAWVPVCRRDWPIDIWELMAPENEPRCKKCLAWLAVRPGRYPHLEDA